MPDAPHLTAPPGALIAQMSRIAPTGDTDGRARKFNRGGTAMKRGLTSIVRKLLLAALGALALPLLLERHAFAQG